MPRDYNQLVHTITNSYEKVTYCLTRLGIASFGSFGGCCANPPVTPLVCKTYDNCTCVICVYILHPPHPHFISIPHNVAVTPTASQLPPQRRSFTPQSYKQHQSHFFYIAMSDSDNHHAAVQQEKDAGLGEQEAFSRPFMHGPAPQQTENTAGALNELRERLDRVAETSASNHHELVTQNHAILGLLRQVIALIQEGNQQGLGEFSTPSICHSLTGAK